MSTTEKHRRSSSASSDSFGSLGCLRRGGGSGASSPSRLTLVSLAFLAVLVALPVARASAADSVALAGTGAGTIQGGNESNPPNEIECTNVGNPGGPGTGSCSFAFPLIAVVNLTAVPAPGSEFVGWSGNANAAFSPTCNSGSANPCSYTSSFTPATITATFEPLPQVDPPRATTGNSEEVGPRFAVLRGQVDPEGSRVGRCYFEYGPTAAYGSTASCQPSALGEGTDDVAVDRRIAGLVPSTTYHYRLVASNSGGASEGEDLTFTTAAAAAGNCPNEAIRQEQDTSYLPDCMALEMASPVEKGGGQGAHEPSFSADGSRLLFRARAALAGTPGVVNPLGGDPYVASRGALGWATAPTTPPAEFGSGFEFHEVAAAFSPDFGRWISSQADRAQFFRGQFTVLEQALGGAVAARSPLLDPVNEVVTASTYPASVFLGSSPDLSHLFLSPGLESSASAGDPMPTYLPGDPEPTYGSGAAANAYVLTRSSTGTPAIALLARDSSGKAWGGTCGAWVGGGSQSGRPGGRDQGAVSIDGSRVYFSTRPAQPQPIPGDLSEPACDSAGPIRILRREETPSGVQISELVPGGPATGSDYFEAASADGTKVYFTTSRQLAPTDHDTINAGCSTSIAFPGCDLYLYDSARPDGERLVQVSAGETDAQHEAGKEADVYEGVVSISGDGSRAYFVATGVLTERPNPEGAVAVAGKPNLYLYEAASGRTSFIGTLAAADRGEGGLFGSGRSFNRSAEAVPLLGGDPEDDERGGDGQVLAFRTDASLTADDADGGRTDVYRYDSAARPPTLTCVSCASGAAEDTGAFDVTGASEQGLARPPLSDFAEISRWASEDGDTIAFSSRQRLLPGGPQPLSEVYFWRDGELFPLPGVAAAEDSPVVSHDGREIAFATSRPLLPADGDSASDVYIARVDGGFSEPTSPEPCQGEGCQGPPSTQPGAAAAATAGFAGMGNVKRPRGKSRPHHKRKRMHHRHRRGKGHGHRRRKQLRHHGSRGAIRIDRGRRGRK